MKLCIFSLTSPFNELYVRPWKGPVVRLLYVRPWKGPVVRLLVPKLLCKVGLKLGTEKTVGCLVLSHTDLGSCATLPCEGKRLLCSMVKAPGCKNLSDCRGQ